MPPLELVGGPQIPIVGQPCVVHGETTAVSVVITCNCQPGNAPALLRGADVACICGACGNIYQIVKAEYDVRHHPNGLPAVAVACVGRHTTDRTKDS